MKYFSTKFTVLFIVINYLQISIQAKLSKRSDTGGRQHMQVDDRYPKGVPGEIPSIVLQKDKYVQFNCSSYDEITSCKWMAEPFNRPCIISTGDSSKECAKIEGWSKTANFQARLDKHNDKYVCSIHGRIGYDSSVSEEGEWKCILETFTTTHETVFADEAFNIQFLKPATVTLEIESGHHVDTPNEAEILESEELEVNCVAANGLPQPTLMWYLNSRKIDFNSPDYRDRFSVVSTGQPSQDIYGHWTVSQRIKYIASLRDNGEYLKCIVEQIDHEGSVHTDENNANAKCLLSVKNIPEPPAAVSMSVIGAIIALIVLIILIILFLAYAKHTSKYCFKQPVTVLSPYQDKPILKDTFTGGTDSVYYTDETTKLLGSHIDIQTDDMDDPITKVTKYQTHLIMLGDKLLQTPDSKKLGADTDSLARATANLLKNMANTENDANMKNRFLLAAKGLTDSVGLLLSESDKSAGRPGDETVDTALQQVKTNSAESVVLVRTLLLLRQLEQAARAAVKAANDSINVAREASNDNDDLSGLITELDVVARVLDENIENFSNTPSNADTQSYLIIGSKRFLEPSNEFITKAKEYIQTLVDEGLAQELQDVIGESEVTTNDLEAKLHKAENDLLTLDVEAAAELIRNLVAELETIKADGKSKTISPASPEEAEQIRETLNKASKKVRWGLDQVFTFAVNGDMEAVSRAAQDTVPLVAEYKAAVENYAAASGNHADQEIILDHGLTAVNDASIMMSTAHRTVLNPANPLVAMSLLQSSNHVGQTLKATMLSNPDMLVINSHKLTKALGDELDEFQAALDALKVKPLPGMNRDIVSSHLKESDSAVRARFNELITAAINADKPATNTATKEAVLALDNYKNATKEVATILTDKHTQHKIIKSAQKILSKSADMFLEAQNVVKTPGNQANAMKLQETARNIASVMKELEKTYIFGAPGQEQYVTALNIMKNATRELQNPSPSDKRENVSTVKTRLTTSTMQIAQLAQDIVTRSHSDPESLDGLTPRLAQQYHNITSDVNTLLAAVDDNRDPEVTETKNDAVSLGRNIVELIENTCIQHVIPGHEIRGAVAGNAGTVAECSVKLLQNANSLAKKAQALDDITSSIAGIINSLDTTIMFTTAGTLELDDEKTTFGDHREEILKQAQEMVNNVKKLLSASSGSRSELTTAAAEAHANIGHLVDRIKSGAASLGSGHKETQVMLLNSARDVCMSLHGLLTQAKTANGHDVDHPSYDQVTEYSKGVILNITNFLKSVKMFEDESSRGTRAVESSIEAIAQEIHEFVSDHEPSMLEVTAEDVIRANRSITAATQRVVAAATSGNQEDLLAAANIGRRAITELLTTCKGAALSCKDESLRHEMLSLCNTVALQYKDLLKKIVSGSDRTLIMESSRDIAQNATTLAGLAKRMKGDDLVDMDDPIVIAETELLSAAEAIEQAARNLETLRPRSQIGGEKVNYEDMAFDELIIDSAKSIANATSSLIKAASEAQKELVASGAISKEYYKGSDDVNSQWSEGLVSAARLVASATHSLCDAANKLVRGEAAEEILIAAAKQVSKSTAQLVLACKVKTKEGSRAMEGLQTASDKVRRATEALVKAAQNGIKKPPSPKIKVDKFKLRIEAEARVIKLEKELEEAKENQKEIQERSQRTVKDIKLEREAESEVMSLTKELEEARKYCLRLNEEEYNR